MPTIETITQLLSEALVQLELLKQQQLKPLKVDNGVKGAQEYINKRKQAKNK